MDSCFVQTTNIVCGRAAKRRLSRRNDWKLTQLPQTEHELRDTHCQTDVELTFLFAHSGCCSSPQATDDPHPCWYGFDLQQVNTQPKDRKGPEVRGQTLEVLFGLTGLNRRLFHFPVADVRQAGTTLTVVQCWKRPAVCRGFQNTFVSSTLRGHFNFCFCGNYN